MATNKGHVLLLSCVAFIIFLGGCGHKYDTYKVTGKITLRNGTPVSGIRVTFERTDHKMSATASTDSNGCFELTTLGARGGAPTGTYDVLLTIPETSNPDLPSTKINPKYSNPQTSGLQFTVGEQNEHFDIVLDPPMRRR